MQHKTSAGSLHSPLVHLVEEARAFFDSMDFTDLLDWVRLDQVNYNAVIPGTDTRMLYFDQTASGTVLGALEYVIQMASVLYGNSHTEGNVTGGTIRAIASKFASKFPEPGIGRSYPSHRSSDGL